MNIIIKFRKNKIRKSALDDLIRQADTLGLQVLNLESVICRVRLPDRLRTDYNLFIWHL